LLHNSGIDLCDYALLFECVIFIRKVKEGAKPQFFDPKVSSLAPYSQSKPSQSPLKAHSKPTQSSLKALDRMDTASIVPY
jgi:hypothetical protein